MEYLGIGFFILAGIVAAIAILSATMRSSEISQDEEDKE